MSNLMVHPLSPRLKYYRETGMPLYNISLRGRVYLDPRYTAWLEAHVRMCDTGCWAQVANATANHQMAVLMRACARLEEQIRQMGERVWNSLTKK